jgi:rhomboid family GlyGly-CTERM serine protease
MQDPPSSSPVAARWRGPVVLASLMLALQAGGEPVYEALRYERSAVLGGQLWRLLTAHLVHLGWTHCLLNLGGLAVCAAFAKDRAGARAWAGAFVALALGVSALLLLASPRVADYAGLSGVLYGLFVWVLAPQAWRGDLPARLALAVVVARIGWQLWSEPTEAQRALIGGEVLVQAHLYGAACAVLLVLAQAPRSRSPA